MKDKIVHSYLQSIYDLSLDKDDFKKVDEGMNAFRPLINDLVKIYGSGFMHFMKPKDLKKLFTKVGSQLALHEIIQNTINVMLEYNAIKYLPEIVNSWKDYSLKRQGYIKALVTSAVKLDKDQEKRLLSKLQEIIDAKVYLEIVIDKSIIGGIIIDVNNRIFDDSIKGKLNLISNTIKGSV